MIVAVVKNQIIASHNVIVGDKQKQLLNYIPQEVILGVFFYYHSKCASNCNSCNGSCTSGCNSGCTGSCASCTGCLVCTGHCNNCTGCRSCNGGLDCGFTCTSTYHPYPGFCPGDCVSKCNGCLTGCYLCNDIDGSACHAGNGYICSQEH